MTRGEIYRTRDRVPERGGAGIPRRGVAGLCRRERQRIHGDLRARLSEVLGLETEIVLGPEDGLPRLSAVRCDFVMLMFKRRLTDFIAPLALTKIEALDRALAIALDLPRPAPGRRR